MTSKEQQAFVWMWLVDERGKTTLAIATANGLALRTVQERIQRARDHSEHMRAQGLEFGDRDHIRVVVRGIVASCLCIHGRPLNSDGTWVCGDCTATNNPKHRRFSRGRISQESRPDPELSAGEIAAAVQPHGAPKSKLANDPPNLPRRSKRKRTQTG